MVSGASGKVFRPCPHMFFVMQICVIFVPSHDNAGFLYRIPDISANPQLLVCNNRLE